LIAWLLGEAVYELVPAPKPTGPFGSPTPAEVLQRARADLLNALLAFVPWGAVTGLALGLAGGIVRRSAPRAAVAAGVGLIVGALLVAGATLGMLLVRDRLLRTADEGDLLLALVTHGGIWAAVGAAGGLALGLGLGGRGRVAAAVLGGVLGAVAGTVLYEFLGGLAFPLAATHRPLAATPATRLLARLLVTTLAAAVAVWSVRSAERTPRSAAS
jgi:hypothetical protein